MSKKQNVKIIKVKMSQFRILKNQKMSKLENANISKFLNVITSNSHIKPKYYKLVWQISRVKKYIIKIHSWIFSLYIYMESIVASPVYPSVHHIHIYTSTFSLTWFSNLIDFINARIKRVLKEKQMIFQKEKKNKKQKLFIKLTVWCRY